MGIDIQAEVMPYKPDEPSEIYVEQKRTPSKIPGAPPEAYDIHTDASIRNFPSPMDVLNALEIAKALIIQSLMQAQQAGLNKNPNFGKPPWAKNK